MKWELERCLPYNPYGNLEILSTFILQLHLQGIARKRVCMIQYYRTFFILSFFYFLDTDESVFIAVIYCFEK